MKDTNTLLYKIQNEITLTNEERLGLYNLVSSGCRKNNKERLYNIIVKYGMIYDHYGIYGRVYFENNYCRYYAGQSYTDEIRNLRDCILQK